MVKVKKEEKPDFDGLVALMARLRGPRGCPWDRKQTPESLKPYILEEAYEVLSAIEKGDWKELRSELGDLLFQVVFQARLAEEAGRFGIAGVVEAVLEKMVRRHPHVFGEVQVRDADEVVENWEKIKRTESAGRSVLEGVDPRLPALLRACRIQEKVAKVGFDWENWEGAFEKLREELEEFKRALAEEPAERAEEEMGDILFALVNVSRLLGINPEEVLRRSIVKFEGRFQKVEEGLRRRGVPLEKATLNEMEALWQEVKNSPQRRQGRKA